MNHPDRPGSMRTLHPGVQDLAAQRPCFAAAALARSVLFWGALAGFATAGRAEDGPDGPTYPELAAGESSVWVDLGGVAGWLTDRAHLASFAPIAVGFGFGHRVGVVRLAWRLHLFSDAGGDRPLKFLFGDLLSIERVYGEGRWRPYWRVALGFGVDLRGATDASCGGDGYFNADNGASGGLALTHGWGLDAFVTERWFVRGEAALRVHGAAGPTGVLWGGHLGVGLTF